MQDPSLESSPQIGSRPVLHAAAMVMAGMGVRTLLQLGLFVGVARLLGAMEYGAFVAVLAWVTVFAPLSGGGAITVLVRDASRNPGSVVAIFRRTMLITAAVSALLIAVNIVVGWWLLPPAATGTTLICLAIAELLLAPMAEICARTFQSQHAMLAYTATNVGLVAARATALVALWLVIGAHPSAAQWAISYACASMIAVAISVVAAARRFGRVATVSIAPPYSVGDGLLFAIGTASSRVHAEIDKTVLARLANFSTAGAYSAAARVVDLLMLPVVAMIETSAAHFYRHGAAGPRWGFATASRMIYVSLFYVLVGGGLLWFLSDRLVLILGDSFAASPAILRVLLVIPLIAVMRQFLLLVAQGSGHQKLAAVVLTLGASINVLVNVAGVPIYGWHASFAATLLAEALMAGVLFARLRQAISRS